MTSWGVPGILEETGVSAGAGRCRRASGRLVRRRGTWRRPLWTEWQGWEPSACSLQEELADFLSSRRSGHIIEAGMFAEERLPDAIEGRSLRVWSEQEEELADG